MKKHCMIDLETLSQEPRAAVISIGACIFDANGIHHTFKVNIRPESAKAFGMIISSDTVEWWSKQSKEAQKAALERNVMADFGLGQFVDWYNIHKPDYIWSQGIAFDIVILEYALKCVSLDTPWKFRNVMDCRTVLNMFGINTNSLHATAKTEHHDALEDAKVQANALIAILGAMGWGTSESPLHI